MSEFDSKYIRASEKFLLQRDYKMLDMNPKLADIQMVAKDSDGSITFVTLYDHLPTPSEYDKYQSKKHRAALENQAIKWFENNTELIPKEDCRFVFDTISIHVVAGGKAVLRHHINALGISSTVEPKEAEVDE